MLNRLANAMLGWLITLPRDAWVRTESENTPVDAVLLAADGAVPDLEARLNDSSSSRSHLSAQTGAPAPDAGGLLRERVRHDHAPVRDWQFGGQMCPRCLQAWPCLPVGRYAGEEWRGWVGL